MAVRIGMWSGPRNISTALMRSFENRSDTSVVDEPLYAHYLYTLSSAQQARHPGAALIMQSQPTDWRRAVERLLDDSQDSSRVRYQKHMAHHLTDGVDLDWVGSLTNAILIRQPRDVIVSFAKVIPDPTPQDIGFPQQIALLEHLDSIGRSPIVIESRTVLESPETALRALCAAVGIEFQDRMLRWPAGPRNSDGVWAPHWYANVERSTTFAPYTPRDEPVPPHLEPTLAACQPLYDRLAERAMTF